MTREIAAIIGFAGNLRGLRSAHEQTGGPGSGPPAANQRAIPVDHSSGSLSPILPSTPRDQATPEELRAVVWIVNFSFSSAGSFGILKVITLVPFFLLGMLAPDAGSTHIFGEPSMELSIGCRQRIGYLSEESVYEDLPIAQLLEFHSHFFEAWDWGWCDHLIDKMNLRCRGLWELLILK